MNFESVALIASVFASLVLGGGYYLAFQETRRLRERNEDLSDQLRDAAAEVSQLKERTRNLEDARAAMSEHFRAASQQALSQSTEALLKRAEENFAAREKLALERMGHTLKPVAETLGRFEAQVKEMEESRAKDTGGLKEQITHLMQASVATREVTQKLANALRRGAGVQGRWGEETLRNVLESAGLSKHFDFVEQQNLDTDMGRRRPDVTVKLPGGVFVIDAKANLTAYLEAIEATDEGIREEALQRHARALQQHVRDLSAKAYWDQFREQSPDFVAMFVPGDGILSMALERMPHLMTEAMDRKVIIVTPTTLFALCKAVAYGWRAEEQIHNAHEVAAVGRELYSRLSVMGGHVAALGKNLGSAVDKYNAFVGSLESQVLTQARRFEDLKVSHEGKEIVEAAPLDVQTRPLSKLTVVQSGAGE
ncbi:DNA recombination protein RmuC [Asticcacaulis sp. DW145]|uniref:DNA recombination protein RmuC homolog n=1 Tax=Asticcacaulis currens TaxID=2984210 RepID=A0ABT5ICD0_9CAUL|nr:DNA recombination protein RmuC [Asticcacaulis currens]MDC7693843.1 DNA recombination protein RmuC [Asticcacaulis currens]BEV10196.1 DNA recombination protein RmuC [Asticcacaulis sp. DW145]